MALQPSSRPAGSAQVLRFTGEVAVGEAIGTFPKTNGTLTSGGAVGDERGMRFLLADATDLTDMTKRFPAYVFDDQQPAADSPHSPVATAANGLVVNADEQDVSLRTWAQNTSVVGKILSTNVAAVNTQDCMFVLDTETSGLGTNTGLPVLIVPVTLSGETVDAATFDIQIEIRWSAHR